MKWSEQAWQAALPAYNTILKHDFVLKLMDGTLSQDAFRFYLQQDALYLKSFGKVLCGIAAKLDSMNHSNAFISFASDSMYVERELHESYFELIGKQEDLQASPTCLLYTSYMLKQLQDTSVEVAIASVLPCFWVYKKVGDYILANQTKGDNPYQEWINTYASEEYGDAVKRALAIGDELASKSSETKRQEMTSSYVLCTKMEWMFWDSAYKLEQWPI